MTAVFETWAESNLRVQSKNGNEWTCWCNNPSHDDTNPSMRFNVEKGAFICFSCGHKGRVPENGVMNMPEYDYEEVMRDVRKSLARVEDEEDGLVLRNGLYTESYLARFVIPTPFWDSRKINKETVNKFELGFDFVKNAATIPERDVNGQLLGVTRRFLEETKSGKYHYPKGFVKKNNLFGSWLVVNDPNIKSVAITEGALDTIRLWQAGIPSLAIYGSMPSAQQVNLLDQLGIEEVVLFLDNDKEGRAATRRCLGHWKEGRRTVYRRETDMGQIAMVRCVNYLLPVKDAGMMTDYAIRRHFEKAARLI